MKKCKSCQTEIDERAKKCPNCRADQRGWFRRHPILTVLLVLFIIGMIGGAAGGGKSTTSTSSAPKAENSNSNSETQPTQAPTAEAVAASDFIAEFDKNQLSAEQKYKDKLVEFSAKVKNISEDVLSTPYLSLEPETADKYYYGTTIKCSFKDKSELTSLANGQIVKVQGKVQNQSLGIISIGDCRVVQ